MKHVAEITIEEIISNNEALIESRKSRPVVKVTPSQFVNMITENAGTSTFVTAYNVTSYGFDKTKGERPVVKKHRQTKEPTSDMVQWPIDKGYTINFNLLADYERIVKAQLKREGKDPESFEREDHSFIRRFDDSKGKFFGYHKDDASRIYLMVAKPHSIGNPTYVDANGRIIESEELKDLQENVFPKKSKSKKQGTDKEVLFLNPKLENIQYFVMNKVIYEILH